MIFHLKALFQLFFLNSGITKFIPIKPNGKEVFHVSYKNVDNELLVISFDKFFIRLN